MSSSFYESAIEFAVQPIQNYVRPHKSQVFQYAFKYSETYNDAIYIFSIFVNTTALKFSDQNLPTRLIPESII